MRRWRSQQSRSTLSSVGNVAVGGPSLRTTQARAGRSGVKCVKSVLSPCPRPAPEWKYPWATSDEAEQHWNGSRQDDPEILRVLNPRRNGVQKSAAGEGGLRGTATCADREAAEMAGEGGYRGTEESVVKETADADESLETGGENAPKEDSGPEDTSGYGERRRAKAATLWEERGPCRYEVQPQRDMRRRGT
ncbi:hypothetical protein NDU88_002771 [Pleurodeles waltl]|uniref:Uncharacterized protein n=1 Tax=Pleurodeles waltl TaxID=8319 RepID=A0AAV7QAU4_PLEWA|nr:hypothetical protein NDU88_002771 [Pleurodeles waltl]